jgi:hypothetical protein
MCSGFDSGMGSARSDQSGEVSDAVEFGSCALRYALLLLFQFRDPIRLVGHPHHPLTVFFEVNFRQVIELLGLDR